MPGFPRPRPELSAALECTNDAVLLVDDAFRCTYANPASTELLGHAPDALLGAQLHELLGCGLEEDDPSCVIQAALAAGRDVHSARGVMRQRDGQWIPVATSTATLVVEGALAGAVLVVRDASQQMQLEHELVERALLYREVVSAAPDPFFGVLADGSVTSWNAAAEEVFGHTAAQAIGRDAIELLIPERHRDGAGAMLRGLVEPETDDPRPVRRMQTRALHRDGRELFVETTVTRVSINGMVGVRVFVRDFTKEHSLEQQLRQRILRDPLTGLPNRILMMDRLEAATRRVGRTSRMVAVLFLDIDNFKVVNDSLGHDRGDDLLVAVADRLRLKVRDSDTVARFGGDEFVIVMDAVEDAHRVVELAQRLLRVMAPPFDIEGRAVTSSISIGIATATDQAATPQSLLGDADAAMYRAKERGRNRFEWFDDGMRQRVMYRLELEGELRHAIDDGQIRVRYQPIMSVEGQQVVGFEALARWQHPTRGLLGPVDFINVAEETGLISGVGEVVLHEALRQCGDWLAELRGQGSGRELTMAVNLSASQLMDGRLPEIVAAALAQHGVPAGSLCLEITESVLMDDFARARVVLEQLRELGVSIALDDFGTGYSSLLYLREFPVDILKIDRFFVAGLAHSTADRAIVASVVSLAHALNMVAVGEGVETAEQREALLELGCDLGQGFLWDRPLSAPDATACLGLLPGPAPESVAPAATVAVSVLDASTPSVDDPLRIVLVDDNIPERRLLAHTLDDLPEFMVVGEAGSGEEGVAVATRHQPDVLLLDLSMPGVDGVQALPHILEATPDTRVVILSGFISEGVSKMVLASGASGCLDKNSGVDRLPAELLRLLRHSGSKLGVATPSEARRDGDRARLARPARSAS